MVLALASRSVTSPVHWYCFGPAASDQVATSAVRATSTTTRTMRLRMRPSPFPGGAEPPTASSPGSLAEGARWRSRPGGRERAGGVAPARRPAEGAELHAHVALPGPDGHPVEGLRLGGGLQGGDLPLELGLERGLRLLDRGHRLLRPRDVLAFLEHAARSAGGGRGAPERPDADPLPAEERVQDRGPHRDRRLEALLGGLLPLAGLGLLRAPQALD